MSKRFSECWIDEGDGEGYWMFPHPDHYKHQRKPFEGHYPDKHEAKLLRRIMSQTGLKEEEVRAIKKYRVMLSDAQKVNHPTMETECEKHFKSLVKRATRQTALATKHPKTIEVIESLLTGQSGSRMRWLYGTKHENCNNCRQMLSELKYNIKVQ